MTGKLENNIPGLATILSMLQVYVEVDTSALAKYLSDFLSNHHLKSGSCLENFVITLLA